MKNPFTELSCADRSTSLALAEPQSSKSQTHGTQELAFRRLGRDNLAGNRLLGVSWLRHFEPVIVGRTGHDLIFGLRWICMNHVHRE